MLDGFPKNFLTQKEVRPYRNRKNQEKTCLQKPHSDEEDEKAKKKPHSHDYAEDGRCEQCKSIAGLEIMLDGFPKNFLTQKSSFKIY